MTRRYRYYDGGPTKVCSRCDTDKPIEVFSRRVRKRTITSWCDPCFAASNREWRGRNPDRVRAVYVQTPEQKERQRQAWLARRVLAPIETRRCARCMTEFTTNQPRKLYCTYLCRVNARSAGRYHITAAHKRRILERDNWTCYLCSHTIDHEKAWPSAHAATVDHVVPRSRGGSDDDSNLRACHWGCNEAKGDRLLDEMWVAA